MSKTKKEQYRSKLLDYLSNPENPPLSRAGLASKVLKLKNRTHLYKIFNVQEIANIEREALDIRRKNCSRLSFDVDKALLAQATKGNVKAAELFYKRIEGWTEKQEIAVGPNLDQLREYAIKQGYDPDEFVSTYLSVKAKKAGGDV